MCAFFKTSEPPIQTPEEEQQHSSALVEGLNLNVLSGLCVTEF